MKDIFFRVCIKVLFPLLTRSGEVYIIILIEGGVAQLVRACGSYPQGWGFESLRRHYLN